MSATGAVDILLVEDSSEDAELTRRALSKARLANPLHLLSSEQSTRYLQLYLELSVPSLKDRRHVFVYYRLWNSSPLDHLDLLLCKNALTSHSGGRFLG